MTDLLSEYVGQGSSYHQDDEQQQHQDVVGQEEALDLLDGSEAAKAREQDHERGGDQDDVGGVHVQLVPEQLLQERLVVHGPHSQHQQHQATHLQ